MSNGLPEGWEVKKLNDVCYMDKKPFQNKEELPYVGLENIQSMTGVFLGDLIPSQVKSSTFQFTSNHILYGRLRPYLRKVLIPNFEGHCSTEIFPIMTSDLIIKKYLFYWFHSDFISEKINNTCTGARMPRANMKEVFDFEISLPSITKQKEIVKKIDEAFTAIEKAKANIERNIENAKELFQSKLNEIFNTDKDSCIHKSLGDVTDLYQGLAINSKTKHLLVKKSRLPLLRIKDLKNNTVEQYVSETDYPVNALVTKEEIIYTRTGSLGLVYRGREGVLHNNSFKVIPKPGLSNDYLYWWLQHEAFTSKIFSLASKAAQPDITHKLFKKQEIIIPSIEEQEKFYKTIVDLNKLNKSLIMKYKYNMSSLEELKKSILQKAFSGEL